MKEGTLSLLLDARRTKRKGILAVEQRQRARLTEMIAFARANSAYYRQLYHGLPEQVDNPTRLPVTSKKELMAHFDEWTTDRVVTYDKVVAFVGDRTKVGEYFLGRYTALTTSGTSGTRGVFVWDERTQQVVKALAFRMVTSWLNLWDFLRIIIGRGRMSMVMGTGGHFASAVAAARIGKRRGKQFQALSVHTLLKEVVDQLNEFQPTLVAPYGSMAKLLASEQESGRLHIQPVAVVVSAEGLAIGEYDRISKAFQCKVGNSYAATECPFLSYSCEHGWLHVNSDWVILEPVDANYQPTVPGEQSHTVLLTNLVNRVQPILRYDIGDSVLQRPDACPCGNPLMAIRVQGRTSDLLSFSNERGEQIEIAPLALEVNILPGVELTQIVQTTPTSLRVRLRLAKNVDPESVRRSVERQIVETLSRQRLHNVTVESADEPPEQSAGGKYRQVIPIGEQAATGTIERGEP